PAVAYLCLVRPMSRFVTRKPLIFGVAILALALIGVFLWLYTSPFPLSVPKDRTLVDSFHVNRQTFETLKQMADEDATIASNNSSDRLSVTGRGNMLVCFRRYIRRCGSALTRRGRYFRLREAVLASQSALAGSRE